MGQNLRRSSKIVKEFHRRKKKEEYPSFEKFEENGFLVYFVPAEDVKFILLAAKEGENYRGITKDSSLTLVNWTDKTEHSLINFSFLRKEHSPGDIEKKVSLSELISKNFKGEELILIEDKEREMFVGFILHKNNEIKEACILTSYLSENFSEFAEKIMNKIK